MEALREQLKEEMAAEVEENEREMEEMRKTYEQKLKEAEEKSSVCDRDSFERCKLNYD